MNQPALISVIDQDEEIVIIDAGEEEPVRPKPPINVSNEEEDDSPTLESLFPGGNGANDDDDKDDGQLTQCGVARSAHNRIVAGEPAVGDEFPWMAQLDMIQKFGKRESTIDQIAGLTSSMMSLFFVFCLQGCFFAEGRS